MDMSVADLRKLTHEAAASAVEGEDGSEGTAEAEAQAPETPSSEASSEGQSASDETPEVPTPTEALEGTEETEYFGYVLPPDLTPEQRSELLAELKKRDDHIGKLLRGKDPEAPAPVAEAEEPPAELTDEEILQALGLDPNHPFMEETAKAVLPMARKQIQQDQMLSQLLEMQELAEIDRTWRSSLSGLEKEFGSLPQNVDHDAVMEYAAENGLTSPIDAYWRIAGPGRQAVEALAAERVKKLNEAKAASSGTRPGSARADEEAPLESKTTKGATREAATRLLRELGLGD